MIAPAVVFPHVGVCANCGRARTDLFWHAQDEAFYCADVCRCEARLEILASRAENGQSVSE